MSTDQEKSKLAQRIRRQVEFYFSDTNFRRDKFLRSKADADPQGFVDISVLTTFNRLKELSTDIDTISSSLKDSNKLQLSADGKKIRRTKPLPLEDDSLERTVYVKAPFEEDAKLDDLIEYFEQFGKIERVHMRRTRNKAKQFKGSCFVEFSTQEEMKKFIEKSQTDEGVQYKGTKCEKIMPQQAYFDEKKQEREEARKSKNTFTREMTPDCILKLSNISDKIDWKELQDKLSKAGDVKFTELNSEENNAFVRFGSADECTKVKDAVEAAVKANKGEDVGDLKFSIGDIGGQAPEAEVLTGDEEKRYWQKIWDKQAAKARGHKRRRDGDSHQRQSKRQA